MNQSIEKLRKKLDKDPNSLIFFQLAEEYRKGGNLEEALSVLEQGLRKHPNYWSARVTYARIYHQQGNLSVAQQELEKVVQAVPDHLLANRMLGEIYMGKNLNQDALKCFQMVHMLNPTDQEIVAHIKRLESTVMVPAEPQRELTIPEPPPFPTTAVITPEPEPELEMPEDSPLAATQIIKQPLEPEPETYAPTIQMQALPFLEKTEIIERNIPVEQPAEQQLDVTPLEIPEIQANDVPAEEPELQLPQEDEDLVVESAEPILDDIPQSAPFSQADELSNIANLLLTSEQDSHFQELEPKIEDSDFEIESEPEPEPVLKQTRTQDRTQPIAEPNEENEADELTTETLAELYLNQGLVDKAAKVYQKLLLNDPGNSTIQERLRQLSGAGSGEDEIAEERIEEPVMVEAKHRGSAHSSASDPVSQRAEERKRKINTLENWLTTIRRER